MQVLDSRQTVFLVLHAYTPPDMRLRRSDSETILQKVPHSLRPLREHLVNVPVRLQHHIDHRRNVIVRNFLVKQIAHGIYEHPARRLPFQRLVQLPRNKSKIKSLFVGMSLDATESLREDLRIAVRAARTNLGAPTRRIPRGVRPFDGTV